jgi:hypothetical protein
VTEGKVAVLGSDERNLVSAFISKIVKQRDNRTYRTMVGVVMRVVVLALIPLYRRQKVLMAS